MNANIIYEFKKKINNRFIIILICVNRTREIIKGSSSLLNKKYIINKNAQGIAIKEISYGFISINKNKLYYLKANNFIS